jgi:glycerate-2-kinase
VTLDSLPEVLGLGGPNQEVVLAASMALAGDEHVALLSMDTDGSDGGSPNAGGIADGHTLRRAQDAGIDPENHLRAHTSGEALRRLGDLLDTGPTGTNANDLFVVVVGKG